MPFGVFVAAYVRYRCQQVIALPGLLWLERLSPAAQLGRQMNSRKDRPEYTIFYDVITKSAVINVRGTLKLLGPFGDRSVALEEARTYIIAHYPDVTLDE